MDEEVLVNERKDFERNKEGTPLAEGSFVESQEDEGNQDNRRKTD